MIQLGKRTLCQEILEERASSVENWLRLQECAQLAEFRCSHSITLEAFKPI